MNDNENKNASVNGNDSDSKLAPLNMPPSSDNGNDSDSKLAPSNMPPSSDNGNDSDSKLALSNMPPSLDNGNAGDNKSDPTSNTIVNNVQNNYYTVNTTALVPERPAFNTSSIFGFVRSMFSSVVSHFFTGGFFNSSPLMRGVQNFLGQRFGFAQPQQSFLGGFMQPQTFTQNQISYSQSSSKTMLLEGSDNKEVWLTNESEEETINATTTTGTNILAGNNKDNQIFGGKGVNDMWGGSGKTNDFLFGGEGKNNFWYGKGQGVDLVENTKTGDTINFYNVTLGDISNIEITDSSISVVVGENEGLAVNTNDKISPTFKLADGESYSYNRSSAEWQSA